MPETTKCTMNEAGWAGTYQADEEMSKERVVCKTPWRNVVFDWPWAMDRA